MSSSKRRRDTQDRHREKSDCRNPFSRTCAATRSISRRVPVTAAVPFGGGDRRSLGTVTIGAFPDLAEPQFQTTTPTLTETSQITGGVAYEGVWQNVGQLSLALQKSAYERTLTRNAAAPVEGRTSPWM